MFIPSVAGKIKVTKANGHLVGYVSRSLGPHGCVWHILTNNRLDGEVFIILSYGIASGHFDRLSIFFKPTSLFKIDIVSGYFLHVFWKIHVATQFGSPYPNLGFNGGNLFVLPPLLFYDFNISKSSRGGNKNLLTASNPSRYQENFGWFKVLIIPPSWA